MDENTGGAGPALAAHSKDASAPGQTPASEASVKPKRPRSGEDGDAIVRMAYRLTDLVREQPIASMAVSVAIGVLISKMLGRR
jgi:ElaB/YqjD/DUF883 family membrane-anchored ribosome-binding protein